MPCAAIEKNHFYETFAAEMVGSAFLVGVAIIAKFGHPNTDSHVTSISIALAYAAMMRVTLTISGGSLNPALALG